MEHCRLSIALLFITHQLCLCSGDYRVYIREDELRSYFNNTQHSDTVQGQHVDIIRHCESQVSENGSLVLSTDDVSSGSGMALNVTQPLLPPLPPLPSTVNEVTISLQSNTTVIYTLRIINRSESFFLTPVQDIVNASTNGSNSSAFPLDVTCKPEAMGEGFLTAHLTTTVQSTDVMVQANFTIMKECNGRFPSMSTFSPTIVTSYTTFILMSTEDGSGMMSDEFTLPSTRLGQTSMYMSETTTTVLASTTTVVPSSTVPLTMVAPSTSMATSFSVPASSEEMLVPYTTSLMPVSTQRLTTSLMPVSTQTLTTSLMPVSTQALTTSSMPVSTQTLTSVDSFKSSFTSTITSMSFFSTSFEPSQTETRSFTSSVFSPSSSSVSTSQVFSQSSVFTSQRSVQSLTQSTPSSELTVSTEVLVASLTTSLRLSTPGQSQPSTTDPSPTPSHIITSVASRTSLTASSLSIRTSTKQTSVQSSSLLESSTSSDIFDISSVESVSLMASSSPRISPSHSVSLSAQPQTTPIGPVVSLSSAPSLSGSVLTTELRPTATPDLLNNTIPNKEPDLVQVFLIALAPVLGILMICIAIFVCFIACVICKRKRSSKLFSDDPAELPVSVLPSDGQYLSGADEMEESFTKKSEAPISLWMAFPWGVVSTLPSGIQGIIKQFTVDRRSLSILSTITRGDYGCIVNGQLSVDRTDLVDGHKGVMMKMLIGFEEGYGHHNEIAKFLEHATLLRGLEHPNIATVLRVSAEDNLIPLVLYPIVEYGNMHNFLTFCRMSPEESPLNPVTLQYKVNFGLQIAYAMNFLCDKGIIHPDLALRNCLLDTNYLVKVSDGALSPEFYPECYHTIRGAVRPVRWVAQETLQEGLCTSQSNVWSYGITLWEIVTLAEFPYGEVDNNRSIPSHIMMGARLSQPRDCPDYLYEVMEDCWNSKGENRPNFTVLYNQMEKINGRLATPQSAYSSYSTSTSNREEGQLSTFSDHMNRDQPHNMAGLDYSPVPISYQSRRRRSGRNSLTKNSPAVNRRSTQSRVSGAGSEHLSLTFSVLSADLLGSGSSSEDEEGPEMLSPLAESVVFQMLPSLLKDDKEDEFEQTKHLRPDSPLNLVSSLLEDGTGNVTHEQEHSSKYAPLPSTFISPAPLTPSTITTRLTPCETTSYTSSQFGPPTIRSDDSASTPHPASSPSPDLTSKSSIFGEESNPRYSYISHSNADTVSKTSTTDSLGTSASAMYGYPASTTSQGSSNQLNGGGYSFSENPHNSSRTNGTDSMVPDMSIPNGTADEVSDHNGSKVNGLVDMNGHSEVGDDEKKTVTSTEESKQTSFNLGLGDLSSDLMATFDSW